MKIKWKEAKWQLLAQFQQAKLVFGPATHPVILFLRDFRKTYLSSLGLPLDVSELISELISLIPNAIKVLFLPLQGLATHMREDKREEKRQRRSWKDTGDRRATPHATARYPPHTNMHLCAHHGNKHKNKQCTGEEKAACYRSGQVKKCCTYTWVLLRFLLYYYSC